MNYSYTSILNTIQIELSTNCNALCIGCTRTASNFNEVKPEIPLNKFVTREEVCSVLNSRVGQNIKTVEFCGTIDEPLAYPEFLELLEDIYAINPNYSISIHTNGGLRSEEYHYKMATMVGKFSEKSRIRYSIDGIGETSSIYRQHVDYNKAIANLQAACRTKTEIVWQFLIFPWNKHQREEAKIISKEIGCKEIWFRPDNSYSSEIGLEEIKRIKKENRPSKRGYGQFDHSSYTLEGTDNIINCKFINKKRSMVFLNWEGKIWPCCFFASSQYQYPAKAESFRKYVLEGCEENFNSIRHHTFDEIVEHPFFREKLMRSWHNPGDPRAWRCVEKCKSKPCNPMEDTNSSGSPRGFEEVRHR